jgi:hypothetical protein
MNSVRTMLILVFALSSLAPTAASANGWQSACLRTAERMHAACRIDVVEESNVAIANCLNLNDAAERGECRHDAYVTAYEERGSCGEQRDARRDVCELLGESRYDPDPLTDPAIDFVDVELIGQAGGPMPNPYFDLTVGHTAVVRAGEDFEETIVIYVTDETTEVSGRDCRTVVDAGVAAEEDDGELEYVPEEVTDDLYLQDTDGNVYYCGEISREYEDGILASLDGSFRSGIESAKGGVLVKAFPTLGESHRQEFALGEAEDLVTYVSDTAVPDPEVDGYPCDPGGCLQTFEQSPLEPEATEYKYYLPNVGFILAEALEDGELTGEREELVCTGDSLDILWDDACGIEDPEELLEALCEQASQFCAGDDED